jgi:hypothetical protein
MKPPSFVRCDGWILFGACGAGNGSPPANGGHVFAKRPAPRHRLVHAGRRQRSAGQVPASCCSRTISPASLVTCSSRGRVPPRVEVGEAGRQAREVGGLAVQHLCERARSRRQRFEAAGVRAAIGADQQQATGQVGQRRACPGAGLQQASAEAALQIAQPSWWRARYCAGCWSRCASQSSCWPRWLICCSTWRRKANWSGGEPGEQRGPFGCRQLGGRGGRRRTLIGGKVGDREVCLMTDAADHRQRTGADRPRHSLVVESPEVFDAAATPTDDQHFALPTLAGVANGFGDLCGGAVTLHGCRIDDDADLAGASPERAQDVAQAAACSEVTMPTRRGNAGKGRLPALSNSPSRSSFSLRRRNSRRGCRRRRDAPLRR